MKTKYEINTSLNKVYNDYCNYIIELTEEDFIKEPENKWSAGQHTIHLIKSILPVRLAFQLPGFILRILFGKPNREARSNSDLIKKYIFKLKEGGKASGRFNIKEKILFKDQDKILRKLLHEKRKLAELIDKKSESDLDNFLLPHPLLGKLTLREMLFFTIYHAEHHLKILQNQPYK